MDATTPGIQMASPIRILHTGGWEGDALEDSGSPMQKSSGFFAPTFASLQRTNSMPKKQLSRSPSLNRAAQADNAAESPSVELPLQIAVLKMEGWETDALEDSGSPLRKDGYAAPTFSSHKRRLQEGTEKPAKKNPEITRPEDLIQMQQALTVAVPQSARRTPRPTSSSSDFGSRRSSSFGSSQTSTGDHLTPRLLARSLSLRARELANQPGDSTGGPSKTGSRRQSSFSRALTAEEELVVSGGSAVSQDEGGRKEPDSLERVSEGDESEKRSHLHTPRDCQTSSRSKLSEERHSGGMALGQFEVEFGSPLEQRRSLDGSSDGGVVISDSESSLRASLEGDAELKAFAESVNAVLPGPHGAVSSVGGPMGVGAGPVPTMAAGVVATEIPQSLVPPQNVEEPRLEESGGDSGRPADVSEGAAGVEKAGDVEEQSFQQGGLDEGSNDEKSGKEGGDLESAAGQVDGKNAPVMLRKGGASGEVDECEVETSGSAVHSPSTLSGTLDLQSDVLIAEEKWNDVSNDADDVPVLTSEAGRLVAAEENEVQAKQLEETTTRVEQKLETGGNESGGEEGSDKADSKALEGLVEEGRSDEVEERERSAEDANPEENGVLEEVGTSREGAVLSTEEIQKPSGETSPEQGIRKEGGVESETGADGEDKEERIPKGLEAEQVQENDLETERVGRQDEVVQDEQSASGPTIGEEPEPPVEGGGAELGPEHSGFGKVSAEERGKPARMLNETRGAELSLGEVALTEAGLASESGDASAVAINAVAEMNESDGAEGSKNEDASTSKLIEQSRAAERPQFGGAVEGETPSLEDGEAPAAGAKRSGREKRGETVAAAGGTEKSKSVTAVERRDSYRGDKTATDDGDDVAGKMNEAHLGSVTAPNRVSPERKVRSPESQNAERIGEVAKDKHGDLAASVPSKKERNGRETDEPTAVATGAKAPGERFPVKKERKLVAGKKTREVPAGDSKSEAEKGDADVQGLKRVPVADEGFEGSQESIKEEDGPRKQGGETGLEKASRETFAVCAGQGGGVLCADEDEAESKAGTKTREESFERTEKGASEMTKTKKVTKDRRSDKELRHTGAIEHLEEGPDLTAGSVPAETEKVVEEASVAVGDQQSDGAGLPPKRESGVLIAGTEASTGVTTGTEGATETPKKDKKKKGKKHRERSETEGREAGTEQPESARVLDPEAVVDGTSGGQESRFNGVLSAVEEKAEVAAVTEISKREEREAKETSESPKKARKKKSRKIRTSSEKEGLKEAKEHLGSTAEDKSEAVQKAPVGTETADKQTGTPLAREEIGLSGSESVGKEGKRKKKSKTGKKKHKATEQGVETVGETDVIDAGSASVSRLDGTERGDNEADVQTVLSGAFVEAKGAENKPGVKNIRRNVSQESVEVVAWPEFDSDDTCQSPRGAEKSAMGSRDGFKPVAEGAAPTGPVTSANGADDVSEKLRLALAGRRGKRGSAGSLYYPEQAFGAADVSATGGEKSSQGGVSTDRESLADPDTVKSSANTAARSPAKKPLLFLDMTSSVDSSVRSRASSSAPSSPRKSAARDEAPRYSRQQELDAEWAAFTDRVLSESRAERTERAEMTGPAERTERAGLAEGADDTEEIETVAQGASAGSGDVDAKEVRSGTSGTERLPAASFAAKMASLFRKDVSSGSAEPGTISGGVFDEPLPVKATGMRSLPAREAPESCSEESAEEHDCEGDIDAENDLDNQMRKVSWADENGSSLEERLGEAMHFRQSKFNELVTGTEREERRDRRQLSPPLGYVSRPDLAAKKSGAPAEKQFRELLRTESGRAASVSPRKGGLAKPAWVPPSGSPRCADVGDSKHANVHYAVAPNSGRFGSPPKRTGSGVPPGSETLPRTRNGTPRFSSPPARGTPRVNSPPGRGTPRGGSPSRRGTLRSDSPLRVSPDVPYHKMHTCIEPVKLFKIGAKVEKSRSQSPESAQSPGGTTVDSKKSSESGGSGRNSGSASTESSDGGFWDVQLEEGRQPSSREKRVTFADVAPGGGTGENDVAFFEEPKFEDVALREGPAKPAEGKKESGGLSGLARKFKNVMNGKAAERSGAERNYNGQRERGGSSKKAKGKWELIVEQEDAEIDEGASLIAEAPERARARPAVAAAAPGGASLEAKKAELALRKKRTVIEHRRERARATKDLEELKKNVSAELSDVSVATERLLRRFHVAQGTCQELSELLQGALKADAARAQAYSALASSQVSVSVPQSHDSDVTAACDAARGLASSVGISADEANASAKPAYDKMFDIIKTLVAEEKRLAWESTSRGEPAIRKQWEALARTFEAHERACSLLENPEASPAFGGNELQRDDPWLAGKALQERLPPLNAARKEAALMVASNAKSLRGTETDRIDAIKEALLTYGPWSHAKAWDGPLRALEALRAASNALGAKRAGEARLQDTWAAFESAYAEKKEVFEAAPADPFQSARARFQGPLKRKIGWNGKWVPSHAVLTSAGNLHFFHVDASEQPTSRDDDVSLHISMATVRAHSDGVTLQLACYTHHGKKEDEILLRAPSERERARWGAAFREATVEAVQQEQLQREEAAAKEAKERERLAQLAIEKQVKEFKVAAASAPALKDLLKTSPISPDAAAGEAAHADALELSSQKTVASARKESFSKKEYYGETLPHKPKKSNPELAEAWGKMRYLTVEEAGNAEEDNIA